jgi:predicted dehydrogenase
MLPIQTRRQFLCQVSAIGAGAWAGAGLAQDRSGSTDGPLNVGVVGLGSTGRGHCRAIARAHRVGAVCDRDPRELARTAADHPAAARYVGWQEMFQQERLDAVVIGTDGGSCPSAVIAALAAGLPVYCEAPLGCSIPDVRRIREAARRSGALTQVGFAWPVPDRARQARIALQTGAIGPVREVVCWSGGTRRRTSRDTRALRARLRKPAGGAAGAGPEVPGVHRRGQVRWGAANRPGAGPPRGPI